MTITRERIAELREQAELHKDRLWTSVGYEEMHALLSLAESTLRAREGDVGEMVERLRNPIMQSSGRWMEPPFLAEEPTRQIMSAAAALLQSLSARLSEAEGAIKAAFHEGYGCAAVEFGKSDKEIDEEVSEIWPFSEANSIAATLNRGEGEQ